MEAQALISYQVAKAISERACRLDSRVVRAEVSAASEAQWEERQVVTWALELALADLVLADRSRVVLKALSAVFPLDRSLATAVERLVASLRDPSLVTETFQAFLAVALSAA